MGKTASPDVQRKKAIQNGGSREEDTELLRTAGAGAPAQPQPAADPTNKPRPGKGSRLANVSKIESRLEERLAVPKRILRVFAILLLAILLLSILLIVAVAWPKYVPPPVCTRPACLVSSADILPRLDTSKDVSRNFWNFCCGGWERTVSMPRTLSRWGPKEVLRSKRQEEILRVVTTAEHPTKVKSLQYKLKFIYESCMALDNIEVDGERPLHRIITNLGGWQVLRSFVPSSWDYKLILEKLHSEHGIQPFVTISVVTDPRRPKQSIIKISPLKLGMPDRSYFYLPTHSKEVMSYMRFLKDVTQLLGANSKDASTFSEDMFHFGKRLAEIMPDSDVIDSGYTRAKLESVKASALSLPLYEILNKKFPKAGIDDSTEILVPASSYLSDISNIIATTDRGALNNYLMWSLASHYMQFLSRQFRDVLNFHIKEMTGVVEQPPRWQTCVFVFDRFVGFGVTALLEREVKNVPEIKSEVSKMFEEIRATTQKVIEQSSFESELREYVVGKLETLSLQIGIPSGDSSDQALEGLYDHLHVMKNDFFQNILYGITYLYEEQQRRLINPVEAHRWMDVLAQSNEIAYVPASNKVVVPLTILTSPFFETEYALSVKYGRIGVALASAMVSAALPPWDVLYGPNSTVLSPWEPAVNQSERAVAAAASCMARVIASQNMTSLAAQRHEYEALRHTIAVKATYQAFVEVQQRNGREYQPALEGFSPEEIFFINYAQSLCSRSTPEQANIDRVVAETLSYRALLETTVAQVREFTDVWRSKAAYSGGKSEICIDLL